MYSYVFTSVTERSDEFKRLDLCVERVSSENLSLFTVWIDPVMELVKFNKGNKDEKVYRRRTAPVHLPDTLIYVVD